MLAAVTERAEDEDLRVVAAVVDAGGRLVGLHVMPGAFLSSTDVAIGKAFTACNFGAPTEELRERITFETRQQLSAVDRRLVFISGGLPVRRQDKVAGGVGVSGASADEDAALARDALTRLREMDGGAV